MPRHSSSWRSACSVLVTALIFVSSVGAAPAVADGGARFPDLSGHWAAGVVAGAVAAGHVNGYPDGTFRPDANVTRAEFVKLLVKAGETPMRAPNSWQVFTDVDGHWVEQQGYLDTAAAYGLVVRSDYFGAFAPDRPITRREAAVQAVRLLGRQHAVEQLDGSLTLADGPQMPLWQRRYIQAAMQDGILTGYPDNTFRDGQPISRAEAVAVAERAAAAMRVGENPAIKLTVNGNSVALPVPAAIRSGYLYVPAVAIYGSLGLTETSYAYNDAKGDSRLLLFPGSGTYLYNISRAEFPAGASYAYLRTADGQAEDSEMQRVPLLAATYVDRGSLMVPVAETGGGSGALPFATARYDSGASTVAVTIAGDWPGNRLPQQADLKFFNVQEPFVLEPDRVYQVPLPEAADGSGDRIHPADAGRLMLHVAVDPASPVRLRQSPDGPLLTSLDLPRYGLTNAMAVVDPSQGPVPDGTWDLTYSASGFADVKLAVSVSDHRPAKLGVSVAPATAGRSQTISVKLLDSRDRIIDRYVRADVENAGPTVTVTLPDGSTVKATPALQVDPDTGRPYIMVNGVARFTFTPPKPGVYRYAASLRTPEIGNFDAVAELTVAP